MRRCRALMALWLLTGCGAHGGFSGMVTSSGDLRDYRAFRLAETRGIRLERAFHYLETHPEGAWAAEVGTAFHEEEPLYYEAAQSTRELTSEYLAHLPRGPHAAQAIVLLTAFDTKVETAEMDRLLREARRSEGVLARASEQRQKVTEAILGAVAALNDPAVYDARIEDPPRPLRRALGGEAPSTWGALGKEHEQDLFFFVPTHLQRESRVLTLRLELQSRDGKIASGTVSGADLFVLWTEADQMRALDPTRLEDRVLAANHAAEVLGGAFEARLPASRCRVDGTGRELFMRRCDGWTVWATMGDRPATVDRIHIAYERP
jgi:hypothetical protein